MTRRLRKASRRTFGLSLLILLAVLVMTLAFAGASSSQSQQAPTLRIVSEDGNKLPEVIITGEDIRSLAAGTTFVSPAKGGVWKIKNGGQSTSLVKTGTGTLVFPNASDTGVTKHGQGTLKNSDNDTATKQGTGTLVLTSSNGAAFEFRDLSAAEFDRVGITVSGETLTLNGNGYLGRYRPANAMYGWPFKWLMIVPGEKISRLEASGRIDDIRDTKRQSTFSCASKFCQCNGAADCELMIKSNSCVSMMNCDDATGGLRCYCSAK